MASDDHNLGTSQNDDERHLPQRAMFFGDSDSQILGTLRHAATLKAAGWQVQYAVPDLDRIPSAVAERLAGLYDIVQLTLDELAQREAFADLDAIGVYTTGSALAQFRHDFEMSCQSFEGRRPTIFTGFNGLVFEKFEEGLAWRAGFDVITVNGERDRAAMQKFFAQGPEQQAVVTGFGKSPAQQARSDHGPRLFVFAEQVIVPSKTGEREQLVIELARLANDNPDWTILIKARVQPDEQTFHQGSEHIARIFERIETPGNLSISYEPLPSLLERAGIFATISSTALFEAFERGVPSFVVADFGIRNSHGTHIFHGSGLLRRLDETGDLDQLVLPQPNAGWSRDVGHGVSGGDALVAAVGRAQDAKSFRKPLYAARHIASAAQRVGESPEFQHALSKGKLAWAASDYAEAARLFEQAAELNPRSAKAHRYAAEAWIADGKHVAARRNLAAALSLRPQNRNIKLRLWSTGLPWRYLPRLRSVGHFAVI